MIMENPLETIITILFDLPDLPFDQETRAELRDLIPDNQYVTTAKFKPFLKAIKEYEKAIYSLKPIFMAWSRQLSLACEAIIKKEIPIDELLPLIIDYLPTDASLLEKLIEKIEIGAEMLVNEVTGGAEHYIVVTFYQAITFKLMKIRNEDFSKEYQKPVHEAISLDFAWQPDIKLLKSTCQAYIEFLTPLIRHQIKKDKFAYKFYFEASENHIKTINNIIEDFADKNYLLTRDHEYICKKNEILQLLLSKFAALQIIQHFLNDNKRPAKDRLRDFMETVIKSDMFLLENGKYAYNHFLDFTARFFGQSQRYREHVWNHSEGEYLNVFSTVVVRLQMQMPEEETQLSCKL